METKLKVLALFDAVRPTTVDQDLTPELKTADWKTEAGVLAALNELGYPNEHLAIFGSSGGTSRKTSSRMGNTCRR